MHSLDVNNIRFQRNNHLIEAQFSLKGGDVVALVGENGVGKTTFFDLAAGFLKPLSGQFIFNQNDFTTQPPGNRPLSYLFQECILFDHLSVQHNILLGQKKNRLQSSRQTTFEELVHVLSLTPLLDRKPCQLSGGQKQKACLARSLIANMPILLLDEPLTGIDTQDKAKIIRYLITHAEQEKRMILFSTHHPDEINNLATRVLEINVDKKKKHAYIKSDLS